VKVLCCFLIIFWVVYTFLSKASFAFYSLLLKKYMKNERSL